MIAPPPENPTQQDRVLALLRQAGPEGLTPLQALEHAQCFRLAAVVHRLKGEGHTIETAMVEVPSGKRVARYVLHEGPAQLGLAL
jgi:hypothetical protein